MMGDGYQTHFCVEKRRFFDDKFGLELEDGHTYRWMDRPSYRDARTHLKNDQGWLLSDWRWISGIFEFGLRDGHT